MMLLISTCCINFTSAERPKIGYNHNKVSISARFTEPVTTDKPQMIDTMNSVDETWRDMGVLGETLTKYSKISIFLRHLAGGFYVGLGGILTASVGFDIDGRAPWLPGNGFQRFLSGAVGFPLSIMLVSMTGMGAWTGDIALVARAFVTKGNGTSLQACIRFYILSWIGCLCGAVTAALLCTAAALPACQPCIDIAVHKLSCSFSEVFFRGIGGGCLICLAIFMSRCNRDMAGKMIAIWFPISTYVIADFEHVLASMFFLACGKFSGASYTWKEAGKYLIPATLGNMVGGAILVGIGLSSIPKKMEKQPLSEVKAK